MPSYTYRCCDKKCANQFTLNLSVNEQAVVLCPVCEDRAERILTQAPAIASGVQEKSSDADTSSSEEAASHASDCGCVLHRRSL